jgi:hypothetical protein
MLNLNPEAAFLRAGGGTIGARRSRRFTVRRILCVGEPRGLWMLKRPEGRAPLARPVSTSEFGQNLISEVETAQASGAGCQPARGNVSCGKKCQNPKLVGMARCAVPVAERSPACGTTEPNIRQIHALPSRTRDSALAALTGGDIAAQCPYQVEIRTMPKKLTPTNWTKMQAGSLLHYNLWPQFRNSP